MSKFYPGQRAEYRLPGDVWLPCIVLEPDDMEPRVWDDGLKAFDVSIDDLRPAPHDPVEALEWLLRIDPEGESWAEAKAEGYAAIAAAKGEQV